MTLGNCNHLIFLSYWLRGKIPTCHPDDPGSIPGSHTKNCSLLALAAAVLRKTRKPLFPRSSDREDYLVLISLQQQRSSLLSFYPCFDGGRVLLSLKIRFIRHDKTGKINTKKLKLLILYLFVVVEPRLAIQQS